MSTCGNQYYSGIAECDALWSKIKKVIMVDAGTSMTVANAKTLSTWTDIIAPTSSQTGIAIPTNGYQNNTAEPEVYTPNNGGATVKTHDPAPMLKFWGKLSYCDYLTFFGFDNADKEFYFVLEDGKLWGTLDSSGNFVGFSANFFIRKNAPSADNIAEQMELNVNFQYPAELDNGKIITPDFTQKELEAAQPNGLNGEVTTAWATNVVTVKVTKRCAPNTPYAGLTETTNWEVLSAVADTGVTVSAVDDTDAALGVYILTISSLTDDVVIRGIDDDGSNLTYVTQPITVVV